MPDLLEPADPSRRNRELTASGNLSSAGEITPAVALALSPSAPATKALPAAMPLLLFEQVSKWYGAVIGVNQVTLELRPGITGLVGANGAGKTTLMRLATGQLRPDLGAVRVRGRDAAAPASKRHVGYSPDLDSFYEEMSGRQFVETMARL